MRPLRRSFLLALFTLAVCRAAVHPKVQDTVSSSSPSFPPAPLFSTPNPQQGVPSQSFSGSSSNSFSPSLTPSLTPTPFSISPSATPTASSSHTTSSTSSTKTPTTSPSTTSSSTSSSSSQTPSTSSSTSSLLSSPTSDVTPATTLIVPDPNSFTTSTSSSDDPGPTTDVSSNSATSTSFWDNKSAVAGVFVTIALAALVLVAVIVYMVFRRRQQRKLELAMEAEDFVDRGDIEDPYGTRGASPGPSITQMTMPSHAEAFVSRDIHFGANYNDFAGQGNYGLDYPPAVVLPSNPGWGPTYPAAGNIPHRPGVGPSTAGLLAPPSNSRQPGRESVSTYDSFYGGMDRGYGQAI